ncbi:MAG: hypothetical protein MUF82_02225 [Bacteroidetes bacterium]|nr:hypothetical protein [Bacteroidota bacterium]
MAPQSPLTPEEAQRPLSLIFFAMLAAQVMTVGLMVFLVSQGAIQPIPSGNIFLAVGAVVALGAVSGAMAVTSVASRVRDQHLPPEEHLAKVRMLFIVRMAILEGSTIANAVFYLLYPEMIVLAFALLTFGAFIAFRPTVEAFRA